MCVGFMVCGVWWCVCGDVVMMSEVGDAGRGETVGSGREGRRSVD